MGGEREREREREREIRQSAHGTEKWVEKREKKNKIERRNRNISLKIICVLPMGLSRKPFIVALIR